MKKWAAITIFFVSIASFAAPKPSEYTVTVHVKSSRIVNEPKGSSSLVRTETRLHLDVLIDGEELELTADTPDLLRIGDYRAKLKSKSNGTDPEPSYLDLRKYEILFPDGKTREFQVIGEISQGSK